MLRKSSESGQMIIALIVVLLLITGFLFVGGFSRVKTHIAKGDPIGNLTSDSNSKEATLQLQTLKPKSTPPPTSACIAEEDKKDSTGKFACSPGSCGCTGPVIVRCHQHECVSVTNNPTWEGPSWGAVSCEWLAGQLGQPPINSKNPSSSAPPADSPCSSDTCNMDDGVMCIAKPVIYLYPTVPTLVDVSVETAGKIVVSDPHYPREGWKNVLANPSGELIYDNRTYNELFYESEVNTYQKPSNGIIIASNNLEDKLKSIIYQLGLNDSESREFLDFWVPKLKSLNSPYILFSVIDKSSKEAVDKVIINPAPDTRIEFIAYFKPLNFPTAIEPLKLGNRPERIGFTEVEWGGTLDTN